MKLTEEGKLGKLKTNNDKLMQNGQLKERKPFHTDGYINMLNKYGTAQDNSEAYNYYLENQTPDTVLTEQYETNGLFAKIIDIPAQEAVKRGFKLNIEDQNVEEYIQKKIRNLKFFTAVEEALRWARLYGGAIAVMVINDGVGDLTQPVDWRNARGIEEIIVYDKASVTPDYGSMYSGYGVYGLKRTAKFGMPEYYNVFSLYGSFRIHESRCLLFRNGKMPEHASTQDYRFWGVPEYNRIKRVLRETITAHGDAVKLLERSVQAVYKMKDLAQLLSTEEGEEKAIRRLQVIDMARGILNSIAIDNDGEDYDFKSTSLTGVNEVIDACCNMLSALTEIPQTKLFGRSPAGMSATGESDLENYYSFIDKIRETQIRDNLSALINGIINIGINTGKLKVKPDYELEFEPLWTEKETDRAAINSQLAQTDLVKAQTAQMYIELGILDPSEERRRLKNEGKFGIVDEELPRQEEPLDDMLAQLQNKDSAYDQYGGATGVGVIVSKDGKILVGNREDTNEVSGPGGHIEEWENAERAARRETEEEFGIELNDLTPVGLLDNLSPEYGKSFIFLSADFKNKPLTNTQEMVNCRFLPLSELKNEALYEPFREGLDKLLYALSTNKMDARKKQPASSSREDGDFKTEDHPRNERGEFVKKGNGASSGSDTFEEKNRSAENTKNHNNAPNNRNSQQSSENSLTSSAPSGKINDKNQKSIKASVKKLAVPQGQDLYERISSGEATIEDIINDQIIKDAIRKYTIEPKDFTSTIDTPIRKQKRQECAEQILSHGSINGYDDDGKPIYGGSVKKGYRAEIVIGPPAAGKSSVIVDKVSKNTQSRVLDSDDIKAILPEFNGGKGAGKVHKESSDILTDLVIPEFGKGGSHEGENIVVPIVGNSTEKAEKFLNTLKKAGYEVHLSFNDVTTENSLSRAVMRYISTGRFISPDYIVGIGGKPSDTYEKLKAKGEFDSYSKFDNNVAKGEPAKKVERLNKEGKPIGWEDWQ